MNRLGKLILLSAVVGVFYGINFLGIHGEVPLSQIVCTYAFGQYKFSYTDIVYISTRMMPYLVFIFIYGIYI